MIYHPNSVEIHTPYEQHQLLRILRRPRLVRLRAQFLAFFVLAEVYLIQTRSNTFAEQHLTEILDGAFGFVADAKVETGKW